MKHAINGALALSCALGASTALAQSAVTVYGLVDSGVVHTTNANAQGDSVTRIPSLTSSFPSRVGFRGTEDLGGGLSAFFVLENGLGLDTGTTGQGGRLFGRQAHVGVRGAFGTVTLGRQVNMTYLAGIKSDVLGPHLFSIGSIDGYLPNARSDNAIGYLGTFFGWTIGATYSLGRDASALGGPAATGCAGEVAGNATACRQITGLLGYERKEGGVTVSYDRMHGNAGAAGGLTSSANTDTRTTANGYAMVGVTKLGAGVIERRTRPSTGAVDSQLVYLGATYPLSAALALDAQVARRDTKASADDVTMLVARLTYSLSKRTAVYTALGQMNNRGRSAVALDAGGTVGIGLTQCGWMGGLRHSF